MAQEVLVSAVPLTFRRRLLLPLSSAALKLGRVPATLPRSQLSDQRQWN
jgi:hypothetical protein